MSERINLSVSKTSLSDFMGSHASEAPAESIPTPQKEEVKAETPKETPKQEAKKEESQQVVATQEPQRFKGRHSDKDLDLPYDAVFSINGTDVSIKDIFNAYTTREEINKRFGELGREKQVIANGRDKLKKEQDEMQRVNQIFEEINDLLVQGDTMGAYMMAMTLSKKAGEDTLENLINESIKVAEAFQGMSEDERKLYVDKKKFDYENRKLNRKKQAVDVAVEDQELKTSYDQALEDHGLTEKDIGNALEQMASHPEQVEKYNKLGKKERVHETISWALGQRIRQVVDEGIKKYKPELADNNDLRLALINVYDPQFSSDDVAEIARQIFEGLNSANGQTVAPTKDAADGKTDTAATPDRAPTNGNGAEKASEPVRSWNEMIARHSM